MLGHCANCGKPIEIGDNAHYAWLCNPDEGKAKRIGFLCNDPPEVTGCELPRPSQGWHLYDFPICWGPYKLLRMLPRAERSEESYPFSAVDTTGVIMDYLGWLAEFTPNGNQVGQSLNELTKTLLESLAAR